MTYMICPECGHELENTIKVCPYCRYKFPKKSKEQVVLMEKQNKFETRRTPLSKPIYKRQPAYICMGVIFGILSAIFFGANIETFGIICAGTASVFVLSEITVTRKNAIQQGKCPYCMREIQMLHREARFKCPVCEMLIEKNEYELVNTKPLGKYGSANNAEPITRSDIIEADISHEEMKRRFFQRWSLQYQSTPEQRRRFKRAKDEVIFCLREVNSENGSAKCHSSEYNINKVVYDVTYHSCTCPDFKKSSLPCKHIYALALNLGIMQEDTDLSGIPQEIKEKMELLPTNISKYFWSLLRRNDYKPFLIKRSPSSKPLFALELIKDTENTAVMLNMLFSRNDLVAKIYENGIDYKPSPKTTKFEIIDYIMINVPDFIKKIAKNDVLAVLDDEVAKYRQNICDYYLEKSGYAYEQ